MKTAGASEILELIYI